MRPRVKDYDAEVAKALDRLQQLSYVTPANRRLLEDFVVHQYSRGASPGHILSQLSLLLLLLRHHRDRDFGQITKADLEGFFAKLEMGRIATLPGVKYRPSTIMKLKKTVKVFWLWFKPAKPDFGNPRGYPAEVNWIDLQTTEKQLRKQPKEPPLTEEEVLAMLREAKHPRDRAYVFEHYESMCRVGDDYALKWKDFEFHQNGQGRIVSATITLPAETKTGSRKIVLVESVPDILRWIKEHPDRSPANPGMVDPEAFVWRGLSSNSNGQPMSYGRTATMLKTLAAKAGVQKRVHPNVFRSSRCTHLLKRAVPQETVRRQGGWAENSRAFYRYVRLVQQDVEDSLKKLAGVELEDDKPYPFAVQKCARCGTLNSCLAVNCFACQFPLSAEIIREIDGKRSERFEELEARMNEMWKLLELAVNKQVYPSRFTPEERDDLLKATLEAMERGGLRVSKGQRQKLQDWVDGEAASRLLLASRLRQLQSELRSTPP